MASQGTGRTWHGESYRDASGHHRAFDDWFLAAHPPARTDRVIDAGCGSGEFAKILSGIATDGHVLGVDRDPSMLEAAARHRAPNLEWRRSRLQDLDQVCTPGWADLVVSRAVFHWIPERDHLACFRAIRNVLRPGGWFHAESGGSGNVARLRQVLDEVAAGLGLPPARVCFPDPGSTLERLEQTGFELQPGAVTTVAQRRAFDHRSLLDLIRTQAAMAYDLSGDEVQLARFLDAAAARADDLRRHDGSHDQTFVRLHVRCRRPAGGEPAPVPSDR